MFAYHYPVNPDYEPRTSQPRRFHRPAQYFHPCSYYASPFYNRPELFQDYYSDDEEEQNERYLQERSKHNEQQKQQPTFTANHQPKKSFKVKIQDDEGRSTIDKLQAARRILNFIKRQTSNKQTRQILNKLYTLCTIENELKEIHQTKNFGNLTFDKEREKRVLPISIENKRFLEYEDKIVKLLDKLDRIQSNGVDIIRERRKFVVKFAQTLLTELDEEKENQWTAFEGNLEDSLEKADENSEVAAPEVDVSVPLNVSSEVDVAEPLSVASETDVSVPSNVVPEIETLNEDKSSLSIISESNPKLDVQGSLPEPETEHIEAYKSEPINQDEDDENLMDTSPEIETEVTLNQEAMVMDEEDDISKEFEVVSKSSDDLVGSKEDEEFAIIESNDV